MEPYFFGLSISEWLGILALGGTVIGTLFTLMKKIVVMPIVKELHQLSKTIEVINTRVDNNEKYSAGERQVIHNRVNKLERRTDKIENAVGLRGG
ncbi:hypothetical protein MCOL2_01040 [Listeria fleischmannii FSL S10-1203]|uniref:Uncharacterized protein n=1 Tax=Listeria fleischmannii FSL S10-1203 TaxID=1265822 RepID=W7DIN4_9LIST|nr:hypothetical protein MCOL2_01040 [Listeria fleischmannii FSL S10-1203]